MRTESNPRESGAPVWALTAELKEIMHTDAELMAELVCLFIEDSSARLNTLRDASARDDFEGVRAQAHSLKGSALQMGVPGLGYRCADLELSERPQPESREQMIRAIETEFAVARRAMESYLAHISRAGQLAA